MMRIVNIRRRAAIAALVGGGVVLLITLTIVWQTWDRNAILFIPPAAGLLTTVVLFPWCERSIHRLWTAPRCWRCEHLLLSKSINTCPACGELAGRAAKARSWLTLEQPDSDALVADRWLHQFDDWDHVLSRASAFKGCANYLASTFGQGWSSVSGSSAGLAGYMPAHSLASFQPDIIRDAIWNLRWSVVISKDLPQAELDLLLSRVGKPPLVHRSDASGQREIEPWPKPEQRVTLRDLLHFYMLVKTAYMEHKAILQARQISTEELTALADAVRRVLRAEASTPTSIAAIKMTILRSWQLPSPKEVRCPRCSYLLTDLESSKCPKCGKKI